MKTWKETKTIFMRVQEKLGQGESVALATVIRMSGSTYRRPGARLLIEQDGHLTGNVSGGCLEEDVCVVGLRVIASGESERIHYETGTEEDILWGMGMGCDGEMDLMIQRFSSQDADLVDAICSCFSEAKPFALSVFADEGVHAGQTVVIQKGSVVVGTLPSEACSASAVSVAEELSAEGEKRLHETESGLLFTDALIVPPTLVLCGAGDDAIPLVQYASDMGFYVMVVDHRTAYLTKARFPAAQQCITSRADEVGVEIPSDQRTYVIVKTRSLTHDTAWVNHFAGTMVPYIGLLGPRARREKILEGLDEQAKERLYGPVGLDCGADVPEQVAVSIVAELLAVASGRCGGHLRERKQAIHEA